MRKQHFLDAPFYDTNRSRFEIYNNTIYANPVINESEKFDFVIPQNKNIYLATAAQTQDSECSITFNRTEGIPAAGHYAPICLPFSVPTGNAVFNDFVFEGFSEKKYENGAEWMVLQEVSSLEAGVPYIFKKKDGKDPSAMTITVSASDNPTFVATPVVTNPHYFGTFINLITKDLHSETVDGRTDVATAYYPYDAANTTPSSSPAIHAETNAYFKATDDDSRVAYFIRADGAKDKIKLAANNTSVRPFRAYFRMKNSDFGTDASGAKVLNFIHLGLDDSETTSLFYPETFEDVPVVDIFTLNGTKVASRQPLSTALDALPKGVYLLSNGKKVTK